MQSLLAKRKDYWLDHFARLGLFSKVESLTTVGKEEEDDEKTVSSSLKSQADIQKQATSAHLDASEDSSEMVTGCLYRWKDWRLVRSRDCLYIWCDTCALEFR